MKKVLALSLFVAIIFAACHPKTVPGKAVETNSNAAPMAAAPADAATLEAGHTIYTTKCTKCHPAKVVENYTVEKWVDILHEMIPKAKLDETESAQVTAYVNANAKK